MTYTKLKQGRALKDLQWSECPPCNGKCLHLCICHLLWLLQITWISSCYLALQQGHGKLWLFLSCWLPLHLRSTSGLNSDRFGTIFAPSIISTPMTLISLPLSSIHFVNLLFVFFTSPDEGKFLCNVLLESATHCNFRKRMQINDSKYNSDDKILSFRISFQCKEIELKIYLGSIYVPKQDKASLSERSNQGGLLLDFWRHFPTWLGDIMSIQSPHILQQVLVL